MFTIKFSLGRTAFNSYLSSINSSKLFSKKLNTLNCRSNLFCHRFNGFQHCKIFNKSQIKFDLFNRKVTNTTQQHSKIFLHKQIGLWLLLCSGSVYGAISLGGYTRLTESGLSMVTWRFTFESSPQTEEEWLAEFEKYKEFPEFKLLKKDIALDDFKKIWMTEYVHRNWGRLVGLIFLFPAVSFWLRGCFKPPMKKRIVLFGVLIAAQGLLGWYMVKSGLEDRFHEESDIPRVSQYRLAAHLGLALTLFTGFFMTALSLLMRPHQTPAISRGAQKIRMLAHTCKGLIFLTAISGALVAGLDAGLVYNSFPKMGDSWIPDDIFALSPKYRNFTENPTTAQFDHRILGIITFAAIMTTWVLTKKYSLPRRTKLIANLFALSAVGQVILGISTLVHYVPTTLAISHQSGSILLLSLAISLSQELKLLKYLPK